MQARCRVLLKLPRVNQQEIFGCLNFQRWITCMVYNGSANDTNLANEGINHCLTALCYADKGTSYRAKNAQRCAESCRPG